jgi:hypothetical protein
MRQDTFIIYIRNEVRTATKDELHPVAVVAARIDPHNPNVSLVAGSLCSIDDQFDKKKGRAIAVGRLDSPSRRIEVGLKPDVSMVVAKDIKGVFDALELYPQHPHDRFLSKECRVGRYNPDTRWDIAQATWSKFIERVLSLQTV